MMKFSLFSTLFNFKVLLYYFGEIQNPLSNLDISLGFDGSLGLNSDSSLY